MDKGPFDSSAASEQLYTASEAGERSSLVGKGGSHAINADGAHAHVQSDGPQARVSLSFKDLVYEVTNKKTKQVKRILNGISGHVHAGQMMAILGPSGAGKTTMLDILARRQKGGSVSGDLLMNGQPVNEGVFRRVSAYVQQEDILHSFLTVQETINYAGRLRLPETVKRADIDDKTRRIMRLLGIEHVRDSKIGGEFLRGVSGGEKKRTAIGVELVTNPSLIFLDEPTTGLDTFTALHLLHLLQRLSRKGATVVFSIHQPRSSIFSLFDVVLVLNGYGEEAYFGPAEKAVDFLSKAGIRMKGPDNPADFLLDSVAVVRSTEDLDPADFPFLPPPTQAQDIAAAFRAELLDGLHQQIEGVQRAYASDPQLPAALKSPYHRGVLQQIWIVTSRAMVNRIRDPMATAVSFITCIFFALLVGSIYWQLPRTTAGVHDRLGVLFFLVMNTAFSSLGALALFMFERSIYVREHKNGMYRPSAYFLGKLMQDVPINMLVTIVFDVIAYFMVGLQTDRFGTFLLVSLLIMMNSYGMCMMISLCAKDIQVANLVAPLLLVLYLLPSGFLINLNSLPVYWRWVKYISFVRFGYQALVENEVHDLTMCSTTIGANNTQTTVCGVSASDLVDAQLGFAQGDFWSNTLYCSISAVVYLILAYLGLRFLRSAEAK